MTNQLIEKFVDAKHRDQKTINIHFKQRSVVSGIFIKGKDYDELKSKNFWRIVILAHKAQWEKTKDMNLARIFSGGEFTRLTDS